MAHGFDCAEKKDRLTEILRALEAWSDPQHAQRPRMGAGDAGKHRLVIIE